MTQLMNSKSDMPLANTVDAFRDEETLTPETGAIEKGRESRLTAYQWWKAKFERVFALLAITISSPFIALIAIIIRLDSPGAAIYRREQVGENGQIFKAYKFRTMHSNNDDHEYKAYITRYILENASYTKDQKGQDVYKVVNDPRVTRFGRLLRKSNLDELPQLFNILKGEMSFVGPRPDIPFAVAMYSDWHRKRLNAKPGITGLWQVCGRKTLPFEGMVRLDIDYIKRQSFLLDARILLLTIGTILKGDGS